MATVYLARDLRHDRHVALKVLHPELAATLGPERFQREIRLAARLQHPHILTVLDSGESAGKLWFTMPFVEGESLRDRLTREKQLPAADALRLARDAAAALDYAHRHGTIHRDVKPENLLLTSDGQVLVADFGIARALGGTTDPRLTETGVIVGTPAYMSPEQASGQRELDGRTDVYSLGAVLYEMLAGEAPFTGPTAQAVMAKRFSGPAPSVRHARATVSDEVDRLVTRSLALVPADRFATAGEMARALDAAGHVVAPRVGVSRPLVAALVIGFVLGLGVLFGWLRSGQGSVPVADGSAAKRLAVLPFENLGGAQDEYFADGVTDEIRGKLAALPGLQVTASRSAAEYKKTTKDLATIARELGVDYLLVGKVRWEKREGDRSRVQVSPELIQVATRSTRWQQPFDANLTDVFRVQAEVAAQVAQALDLALGTGEQETLAERPTGSLPAYDAYLRGEEASSGMSRGDPPSLRQALLYYEQAIGLDSTFAAAWARRAVAYGTLYANSVPDPDAAAIALASAERARALAPDRPDGYNALSLYYQAIRADGARSLEQAELGLKLAPRDSDLLVRAALARMTLGQWEAAVDVLRRSQATDPRSVTIPFRQARALLWLRRYDESLRASEQGLRLAPGHLGLVDLRAMTFAARGDLEGAREAIRQGAAHGDPTALFAYMAQFYDMYWLLDQSQRNLLYRLPQSRFDDNPASRGLALAGAYTLDGDHARARAFADTARAALEAQIRDNPDDAQLHVLRGIALAYLGRKADAIREGRRGAEMIPPSRHALTGPYLQHQLARIYILVGEPDLALDQLEPLLTMPYFLSPAWLGVDPTFESLRPHPRFQRLLETAR